MSLRVATSSHAPRRQWRGAGPRGFTVVELVVVIVLAGVLAAVAGPLLASPGIFSGAAAAESTLATLRAAQRTAVARRGTVWVKIDAAAGRVNLCIDAACNTPITPPSGSTPWLQLGNGLRFDADASYNIDAFGRPSLVSALRVQVQASDGSVVGSAVQVESETGHVRKQ